MSPPISKDWWIAAALTSAALPAAVAQTPVDTQARAGVVSAVTPNAPVTSNQKILMVGNDVEPGQRLSTGPNGQLHVLFLDQSAITLGPDSELVIETFQFDPATRQGQIQLGLAKGLLRVVGGQISKTHATTITTPHGRVEISGGITMVETNGQNTSGTFLFGQGMTATDTNGNTQTVTRAGFGTSFGNNQSPSSPQRIPVNQLNSQLNRLESTANNNSGNQQPGGAPAGQLMSTGNAPGGTSNPGGTLANDRLKNVVDTNTGSIPSNTLRNILTGGLVPNQS
ncbi:FecR domain-containing protein [Acidovorax sp. D2M1]|uniref:FecR domain-containing protein n=1 Tax=Acidovorax benzenivorans TaxID=2987520 RepID=A0ABT5RXX1_9BURK|nr:FecR domain-containing protein [Acidovorax benzenivorans]MDD2177937.1 FecR domain-containing protein [Acidovorax benzenivorans]